MDGRPKFHNTSSPPPKKIFFLELPWLQVLTGERTGRVHSRVQCSERDCDVNHRTSVLKRSTGGEAAVSDRMMVNGLVEAQTTKLGPTRVPHGDRTRRAMRGPGRGQRTPLAAHHWLPNYTQGTRHLLTAAQQRTRGIHSLKFMMMNGCSKIRLLRRTVIGLDWNHLGGDIG